MGTVANVFNASGPPLEMLLFFFSFAINLYFFLRLKMVAVKTDFLSVEIP